MPRQDTLLRHLEKQQYLTVDAIGEWDTVSISSCETKFGLKEKKL